jgi:hypothetical protein
MVEEKDMAGVEADLTDPIVDCVCSIKILE